MYLPFPDTLLPAKVGPEPGLPSPEDNVVDPPVVPSSPSSDGPPIIDYDSLPSTPPVMTPLEWYLYDTHRHEALAVGILPSYEQGNEQLEMSVQPLLRDEDGHPLEHWPRDEDRRPVAVVSKSGSSPASGWSPPPDEARSSSGDEGTSPGADPMCRFLSDVQDHEVLACKLDISPRAPASTATPASASASAPGRPIPRIYPLFRLRAGGRLGRRVHGRVQGTGPWTRRPPDRDSSVSVEPSDVEKLDRRLGKFSHLSRKLVDAGLGEVKFTVDDLRRARRLVYLPFLDISYCLLADGAIGMRALDLAERSRCGLGSSDVTAM